MAEQANNEAGSPLPEPAPRSNAGRFRAGDPRINRDGRPKTEWAACADRAPFAGRLMLLRMPLRDFLRRLTSDGAPRVTNLPPDCEAIASRVDLERGAVALVIRSEAFARVAKGAPLPEFVPEAAPPAGCAPCDDRLMVLAVPESQLAYRLRHPSGFSVPNLPYPFEIVACRVAPAWKEVRFTLRSGTFPLTPKGAPLPEFPARFQGLAFARAAGWDRGSAG